MYFATLLDQDREGQSISNIARDWERGSKAIREQTIKKIFTVENLDHHSVFGAANLPYISLE